MHAPRRNNRRNDRSIAKSNKGTQANSFGEAWWLTRLSLLEIFQKTRLPMKLLYWQPVCLSRFTSYGKWYPHEIATRLVVRISAIKPSSGFFDSFGQLIRTSCSEKSGQPGHFYGNILRLSQVHYTSPPEPLPNRPKTAAKAILSWFPYIFPQPAQRTPSKMQKSR